MYGTKIKKYLSENGIKYSFLADKLKIDRSTLYYILNNNKITIEYYVAICKALKLDLYYFVNMVEEEQKQSI